MSDELNQAYWERNQLVAFLSRLYPSRVGIDRSETNWEWKYVVYVESPVGQLSWHVHASEIPKSFRHLEIVEDGEWDGHTTDEKYERLRSIPVSAPPFVSWSDQDD